MHDLSRTYKPINHIHKLFITFFRYQQYQQIFILSSFYVFDFIDPPAVMEKKSEPDRLLICILSALLGIILGILLVLIRHYVYSEEVE